MMFQLIMGLVITGLVVLYVWLKRTGHKEEKLPMISEDTNLPAIKNDLENSGPQQ